MFIVIPMFNGAKQQQNYKSIDEKIRPVKNSCK